jgi:RNA polymerase sigma-70 factor (ECF subfamily)
MIFLLAIESRSDREKLVSIYNQYKKMIMTIAYDILKDYHEAEDVLQSVIVKVSHHLDGISEVMSIKTKGYIIQITRNHCYDVYNKRRKIVLEPELTGPDLCLVEESYYFESTIDEQMFSDLIKNLKKEYAEILTLIYYHEQTVREVSSILKITENNVSVRLNRAHNALKQLLIERNN